MSLSAPEKGLINDLRNGRCTIGSWITLAHPAIAEIMAKAGFDWLTVDMEHSVLTIREEPLLSPGNVLIFGEGIEVADIRNNLRFIAPDESAGTPGWLRIGIRFVQQ